jgi:hypothetical protein
MIRFHCIECNADHWKNHQIEPVLDAREASIEIVEPTCEADVILVQAEDITAQVSRTASGRFGSR